MCFRIPKAIRRTTETHTLCNPILRIFSGSDKCNLKKVYIQEAPPRSAGPGRFGSLKVKVGLGRVLRAPSWGLEGPKADAEVQEAAGRGQHGPVGPGVVSGAHSGPNLGSIWARLGLKNCVKENQKVDQHLCGFWELSWSRFGSILGWRIGPCWDQQGPQMDVKNLKEPILQKILENQREISIFGSKLG